MNKLILCIVLSSMLFGTTIKEDDELMDKAIQAKTSKKYKKAFTIFEQLSNKKYAKAQYYLSLMYQLGNGVKQDDKKALSWLKSSAKLGDIRANTLLGEKYYNGWGVKINKKKAKIFIKRSLDAGDKKANYLWKKYNLDLIK